MRTTLFVFGLYFISLLKKHWGLSEYAEENLTSTFADFILLLALALCIFADIKGIFN